MSTVRTTPATTRTDVRSDAPAAVATPAATPVATPVRPTDRLLRLLGAGLSAGALIYAGVVIAIGTTETASAHFAIDATGLAFQLGVFCLLAAMWRTAALGTGRLARTVLALEGVVLGVAAIQSVAAASAMGGEWGTVANVLDPSWPLSMAGMVVVGITATAVGRWRGVLRAWTTVAGLWLAVAMGVSMLLPPEFVTLIGGTYLVLGYGVLGLLLAIRPEATRR